VVISGETVGAPGTVLTVTVGALAVVNANGSPVDPSRGLPWDLPRSSKQPTSSERARLRAALAGQLAGQLDGHATSLNTTIGVVATSARLTKAEATKLAGVAHDGLARAIRPAHSMFDGDTVFALATGEHELGDEPAAMRTTASRQRGLNQLLAAAADTFSAACTHAVLAAERRGEFPAYRDLCPSLFI
jgi:L-aminopeptidase/D-esterase-like protein